MPYHLSRCLDHRSALPFFSEITFAAGLPYYTKHSTQVRVQLKLQSSNGKYYQTDCANTKIRFRSIPSTPSKKAEPFKRLLAKVGYELV